MAIITGPKLVKDLPEKDRVAIGVTLPFQRGATGYFAQSFQTIDQVKSNIKNLILTNHYERPFRPELGSNLRRLLFENIDSLLAAQIEREIEETINNFEPRVRISKVEAFPIPDENKYQVRMEFFIVDKTDSVTINFFLERIR
jgi:phage baseplate assembly protein W